MSEHAYIYWHTDIYWWMPELLSRKDDISVYVVYMYLSFICRDMIKNVSFFKIEKLKIKNFKNWSIVDHTNRSQTEGTKKWEIAGNVLLYPVTWEY